MANSSEVMQGQILHMATPGHNPNLKPWGFDPDKSRQYLKDAGFANGLSGLKATTLFEQSAEQKPWAEACAGMWAEVGIDIDLNPVETNLWREQLYGRAEHDHLLWSTFSSQAIHEPSTQLQWYLSDHPSGYYGNQDFDAALKGGPRHARPGGAREGLLAGHPDHARRPAGGVLHQPGACERLLHEQVRGAYARRREQQHLPRRGRAGVVAWRDPGLGCEPGADR